MLSASQGVSTLMSRPTARKIGWSLAALLLLMPAFGMAFSTGFDWGPGDFLAAALLIGITGLGLELAARLPGRTRLVAAAAVIGTMLLIWAELAVGILS
jgi:hypothetical protein